MLAVIVPAHNRIKYLQRALNSLAAQSLEDFQVIVVDDCSDKPLKSQVKSPEFKYPIVWLRHDSNLGPGLTRQTGLDYTYTKEEIDYIAFLDSDDMMYPNGLLTLYNEIVASKTNVVISSIATLLDNNTEGKFDQTNKTFCHGKIYKKAFLQENDIRFTDLPKTNEDLLFNNKILLLTNNYKQIPNCTYLYTSNNTSITSPNSLYFIMVHTSDFIESVYQAILFMEKRKIKVLPSHIMDDIMKLYELYQTLVLLDYSLSVKYKETIKRIFQNPLVKAYTFGTDFVKNYFDRLHVGTYFGGRTLLFNQNFKEWWEEMKK